MSVFALFEDGTASELALELYRQDNPPIEVSVTNQDNQQIRTSVNNGTRSAYYILGNRGILKRDERYFADFGFSGENLAYNALGESAGLAFSLKFTEEIYRKRGESLSFSVAATGMVSGHTAEARVKGVRGINEKLRAAFNVLKEGDKIFCPKENEKEIDDKIREEIERKQIEIIPVSTVKEAIEKFLRRESEPPRHKRTSIKYLLFLTGIMAIAITGYFGYRLGFGKKELLSFKTMEFHYFNPDHNYLSLIEWGSNSGLVLKSGDGYQFKIEPDAECYLYIYQIDSSGRLACLFPNPEYSRIKNPLEDGVSYIIPSEDSHYYLDEKAGEEKIYFLASVRSDKDLKKASERLKALPAEKRREVIPKLVGFYKEFKFRHR